TLLWSPGLHTSSYEVEEATKENFSDAVTHVANDIVWTFRHDVTQPTRYFYRVRSMSNCGLGAGPASDSASIVVIPTKTSAEDAEAVASYGQPNVVVQTIHIPGSTSN